MSLPNKHHYVVDLSPFGLENDNEVFHADDRPYGLIEASVLAPDAPARRARLGPLPPRRMTFALHDAIAELATYNDDPAAGGITREVFTPTYERAVEFVSGLMRDAGLEVRRDAFGNLYGRARRGPTRPCRRCGRARTSTRRSTPVATTGSSACWAPSRRCVSLREPAGAAARDRGGRVRGRGAAVRQRLHRQPRGHGRAVARRPRPARRPRRRLAGAGAAPARASTRTPSTTALWDPGRRARVRRAAHRAGHRARVLRRADRRRHRDRRAHDLRHHAAGRSDHAGATPMALRRDALAGAAEAMVELERARGRSPVRDDGRHRRRHARAPRGDQRRARRGRARRRRARQRRRSPPGGRRRRSSPSSACWPRSAA